VLYILALIFGGIMDRSNLLIIVAVMLLSSTFAAANPIGDPGPILRPGEVYDHGTAIINPDGTITFDGQNVSSYDPFNAGFCEIVTLEDPNVGTQTGPDCFYENQSGQTIDIFGLQFSASGAAILATFGVKLTCFNEVSLGGCVVSDEGNGNAVSFLALGIPPVDPGSPDFNSFYWGYLDHPDFAKIAFTSVNGTPVSVPEPASIFLLFTGLSAMGLQLKRKNRRKC
jgi:PEP-CTERM motif-containing protein